MQSNPETTEAFDSRSYLKSLTTKPGVYQMFGKEGVVLYVGKASNLKNRVSSYFRSSGLSPKTGALVARIKNIEITITHSETEALLLEQNLIKTLRPPYNILLRDDKSYPYIQLSGNPDYPSLTFSRVRQKKASEGRFFGPYTSAASVRESLSILQKTFGIRQCDESFFRNRSRPCLQHQIGRCSAPCVGLIEPEDYQQDMRHATMFLQGRNNELIQELVATMEQASAHLAFEKAARSRDQIRFLRRVSEHQSIEGSTQDIDVFAMDHEFDTATIHGLFIREGRVTGSKSYHFDDLLAPENALSDFIEQYYLGGHAIYGLPGEVLTHPATPGSESIQEAFARRFDRRLGFEHKVRGQRADWLKLARANASHALTARMQSHQALSQRWLQFCEALALESSIQRIECFDISHTFGEATVASCVVFGPEGAIKDEYRRFNIKGVTAGDDFAAMKQALERRYTRLKSGPNSLPDVVLVDGGKGQLSMAEEVFAELQIDGVMLLGVAKGVTRKPGFETLIPAGTSKPLKLPPESPALHLIQLIRDEAHRFAITGHRKQRQKTRNESVLDSISGIGPKRRKDLLNYFGSVRNLEKAKLEDIKKVAGISEVLAQTIYTAFHE